ncbi:hypothetical protein ACHAXT_006623 [Thalassiosira profunda]
MMVMALRALAVVGGCRAFSSTAGAPLVPRLQVSEFLSSPTAPTTPVLVQSITPPEDVEVLADELMAVVGGEEIQMQRKMKEDDGSRSTEIYDLLLQDTVGYMMDSYHDDAFFAFCEGLLPGAISGSADLSRRLNAIRQAPFAGGENWFDYFPPKIRPTDAIILAGAGATSTLHRDPFEWTGTSLCLEGTKIWRFILPPTEDKGGVSIVDEALDSYRLDSIAWEDENEEQVVLSAGWQSDMTLYDSIDDNFPSAFEWVTLEEENNDRFQREMAELGVDAAMLRPNAAAIDALGKIRNAKGSGEGSALFATAIQRPGDLLLIPAHCWHQTYAPVPSVAVASQRCGAGVDGARVIRHILGIAGCNEKLPEVLKCNNFEEGVGEEVVATLLKYLDLTE